LELKRRLPRRLGRDEVGAPEPNGERHVRPLQDGACRQGHVALPASPAAKHHGRATWEAIRFSPPAALGADNAVGPAQPLEVRRARRVVGEHGLEFGERRWEAARVDAAKLAADGAVVN
jgi:hypothetical protein